MVEINNQDNWVLGDGPGSHVTTSCDVLLDEYCYRQSSTSSMHKCGMNLKGEGIQSWSCVWGRSSKSSAHPPHRDCDWGLRTDHLSRP